LTRALRHHAGGATLLTRWTSTHAEVRRGRARRDARARRQAPDIGPVAVEGACVSRPTDVKPSRRGV